MQLKDVSPGSICFMQERMGDDRNAMEVREVFYVRDPDALCRHSHNVRIGRIGIAQGDATDAANGGTPRYHRFGAPCRDPGEADGRTKVELLSDGNSVWAARFAEYLR